MKIFKKSIFAVILGTAVLGSGAHLVHSVQALAKLNEETSVESSFAISAEKDDAVTVNDLPTTALEGAKVDFSLTFDSSTYRVDSVLVNGEKPVVTSENHFSFCMPSKDVVITITGEAINTATKHAITNLDVDKGVVLYGLAVSAYPNETLSFQVNFEWNSGYSFNNKLDIYKVDELGEVVIEEKVEYNYNASNKFYTFTMPDYPIAIDVGTVAKRFSVTRDDLANANIKTVKYSLDDGVTYVSNYNDKFNLPFGCKVQVTLKNSDALLPKKLQLKTNAGLVDVALDEETLVSEFTMPASNISFVITGEVNYKTITITNSEHMTITLINYDEQTGTYTPCDDLAHFVPGDTIYFKVTSSSDDYIVEKIKVSYGTSSTITTTLVSDAESIYSFKMQNSNNVAISVTEKNVGLYKNYPFVGQFYGFNLYGSSKEVLNDSKCASSAYSTNINGAGEIYIGSSSTPKMISSVTQKGNNGLITLESGKDMIYTPNFVLSKYNLGDNFSNNYGNDFLFATKSVNKTDTLNNYSFTSLWSSGKFLAAQSYRTDSSTNEKTLVASFFVDFENKEYYGDGLEFVLDESSTTIASKTSTFTVKVNDVTVGSVSNNTYTKG